MKNCVQKIGVLGWPNRGARLQLALQAVQQWLEAHQGAKKATAILHPDLKGPLGKGVKSFALLQQAKTEKELRRCQALIAIGGDGTVLSAARMALGKNIPLLGVNTGRIGFMADYRVEDLPEVLNQLWDGDFNVRERIMLDCVVKKGRRIVYRETVLNEVHVRSNISGGMVNLNASINGKHLTEFWADSLLVSTPTGSTAYNLSANGPILHPATQAFVLNPVCPVSLSVRPLVVSSNSTLVLEESNSGTAEIVFDGRSRRELQAGEQLHLARSTWVTSFVRTGRGGFVDALREKLGWTGKPRMRQREDLE